MVFHFRGVSIVVKAPFAGTCTNNINQFHSAFTSLCSCTLYSRFSSNKVKFREFSNVEGTGTGGIRLPQSTIIIGAVFTKLPKSRVCYPAYAVRRYHEIGSSG